MAHRVPIFYIDLLPLLDSDEVPSGSTVAANSRLPIPGEALANVNGVS